MPRPSRRRAIKGARTKGHIVDRALELASREGLNGLTIGILAEQVGMSKGGLFAHFQSKEELQRQVLREAIDRFRAAVVEPTLAREPGAPRLRALLDRWIAWDDDERMPGGCPFVGFAAELDELEEKGGGARDMLAEAQTQWLAFLARLAREAVQAGHLRPRIDAELFAFQLQGILLSYHQLHHLLRHPRAKARARAALKALSAAYAPAKA